MTSYVKAKVAYIEEQRGPRLSAMDDYGNIMLYKYSNYITSKGYYRYTIFFS